MAAIKDVAKLAGMSVSAVSKYLKNPESLRPESKIRIEEAIRALHYIPSPIARSLRTKRTETLAVVVPDIINPFFAELFEWIRSRCAVNGILALLQIASSPLESAQVVSSILSRQADGVILCFPDREDILKTLKKQSPKLPVVMMSWHRSDAAIGNILLDVRKGIDQITNHLIDLGHTRIGYVGGFSDSTISKEKYLGFCDAMKNANLPICAQKIRQGPQTMRFAHDSMKQLLHSEKDLQAVVCENDILAVGCITCCLHEHIPIPARFSITGFDDIPLAGVFEPQITTMKLPIREMGESAVDAIMNKTKYPDRMKFRVFDAEMVVRGTTSIPYSIS
jgi:DNA-binding LacI/PurR family transcriptional regulator